ncbi:MAG: hydrogenase nickel incorporation protein HypB [bacterium]
MKLTIDSPILKANSDSAIETRKLLSEKKIFALNLLSSPGAGKTTILERTLIILRDKIKIAVIEGDLQTSRDAERIEKIGIPAIQINTDGGCHLNASMIQCALKKLDISELEVLFIENVGNLVCPAAYDLGEHKKVTVLSIPEGDDKPVKYPTIFIRSQVVIINKIDLLPFTDFNLKQVKEDLYRLNPNLTIFELSCKTGEGLNQWTDWLCLQRL